MRKAVTTAIGLMAVCAFAASASADITYSASYGWEDGVGTILGGYGANLVNPQNVTEPPGHVHSGLRALQVTESPHSGTPQAYVAYIERLNHGDTITASFWGYDDTPGVSPSFRIWAHYALSDQCDSYAGSASGLYDYSAGTGWEELTYDWTFDCDGETRNALVIEARLYSSPSTADPASTDYWFDDLTVQVTTSSVGGSITTPGGTVYAPEPASLALLALGGLALLRRR